MRKADSGRRKCFCLSSVFAALMVLRIQDSMSEGPGSRVFSGFSSSLRNPKAWSLVAASTWTPHCYCSTVAASPITRSRKIFLASYQCVPADPPPRRLPGRVLLTAGRANAGQHLSPTRRRRKASSNSLPAFWIESNRSVPQDGIRLACRSPHVPSFQAQRACAGLDGRVNKFVTFHPTGKRGCGGPPRPLRAGTSRRAMRSIRGSAQGKPPPALLRPAILLFYNPSENPHHVQPQCARANLRGNRSLTVAASMRRPLWSRHFSDIRSLWPWPTNGRRRSVLPSSYSQEGFPALAESPCFHSHS